MLLDLLRRLHLLLLSRTGPVIVGFSGWSGSCIFIYLLLNLLIQLILFALALLQSIVLHSLLSIHRRLFLLRVILALLLHNLIVDVQGGVDEDRGYLLPSSRVIM